MITPSRADQLGHGRPVARLRQPCEGTEQGHVGPVTGDVAYNLAIVALRPRYRRPHRVVEYVHGGEHLREEMGRGGDTEPTASGETE